jgi:hypothetical protein
MRGHLDADDQALAGGDRVRSTGPCLGTTGAPADPAAYGTGLSAASSTMPLPATGAGRLLFHYVLKRMPAGLAGSGTPMIGLPALRIAAG